MMPRCLFFIRMLELSSFSARNYYERPAFSILLPAAFAFMHPQLPILTLLEPRMHHLKKELELVRRLFPPERPASRHSPPPVAGGLDCVCQ
jgi:hypothetical protein